LLGVGSAAAVVVGVVRNKPAHPIAWLCVALALTTFASGDITYDVETEFFHQVNPFPSVADIFYLATVPLLAAGLIMMVRAHRRREGDTGATLDALIITSGCAVLSWIFLIHPYVHAKNITLFSEVVSIFYPLGDILVLGVLVRLVFGGGIRNPSVRLLSIGAVGLLVADCIYGWIQLHGSWRVDGPTDMGWVLFYVLWGAAALHPSMRELTVEQPRRPWRLNPGNLVCLAVTSLIAPLWLVWRDVDGAPRDGGMLASASVVVFVLVIVRLTGLARAQASNAPREQALRSFSERLVAATERSDVWDAVVEAVLAIGGRLRRRLHCYRQGPARRRGRCRDLARSGRYDGRHHTSRRPRRRPSRRPWPGRRQRGWASRLDHRRRDRHASAAGPDVDTAAAPGHPGWP
jgi:hypothetical protein